MGAPWERRSRALSIKSDGSRVLEGTVLMYGDRAKIGPYIETFEVGALRWDDVVLDLQHDRGKPLARVGVGLEVRGDRDQVQMRADLPKTRVCDDVLEAVEVGLLRGLSMEFRAEQQHWVHSADGDPVRVIGKALMRGIGVVATPAYPKSELREWSWPLEPNMPLSWFGSR